MPIFLTFILLKRKEGLLYKYFNRPRKKTNHGKRKHRTSKRTNQGNVERRQRISTP